MTDIVNIASYLPMMAKHQPFKPAIVFPHGRDKHGRVSYTHYTFRQLDEESDCIARGLEQVGIGRGVRTVLMVKPSLEFFALTFALFKAGAVPVVIDPGMGVKSLKKCLSQAEPQAFIGIPEAHLARIVLKWGRKTIKINVTVGKPLLWGGFTLDQIRKAGHSALNTKQRATSNLQPATSSYQMAPTRDDEIAAILFTSGSTGVPKGAIYTHGNFTAQVEMIRKTYQIEPGEIDLPTFPLFALFDPALGMTTIVPDMDPTRPAHVDPHKIIEAIENFGVTNMFGSPALLHCVGRYGAVRRVKLPSLRRIISAGAPVSASILEEFSRMLPSDTQIFTPYGATEALPVSSIGSHEILGETKQQTDQGAGVCVGRPVEGMTVSVIKIVDTAIPEWDDGLRLPPGEIGEITVKGPPVTEAYYHREDSTRLAKIYDPGGKSFWHRMGDLGYFDERGRLWFCGRKSQRVITPSGILFTIPCEGVFNAHPEVHRTALVGVQTDGLARPVLCVELKGNLKNADLEIIRGELLELGASKPHTEDIQTILFHDTFPVDIRHNAKIFREKLAAWAMKELSRKGYAT
jgi:acyl-CoA synthetase (AMP-forming)/AMP-acid ligase II